MIESRNKTKLNQSGFTIVEVVMAGSVGLLLLGAMTSSLMAMGTFQQKAAISSDTVALESMIGENLKAGDTCTLALKNKSALSVGEFSFTTMIDGAMKTIAQDQEPLPNLKITSVQMLRNPALPPVDITTASGPMREYLAVIKVELTKTSNGKTETVPPSKFPVKLLTDVSGNIDSCNAGLDEARVCTESGGIMQAGVCQPLNHCELGGSYSDADPGRGGYPNELTGAQNCPSGFTAVRSGTTTFTRSTSKTFIVNEYFATYSCVRCGTAVSLLPTASFTQGMQVQSELTPSVQQGDGYVTGQDGQVNAAMPTGGGGGGTGGGGGGGCFIAGTQVRLADGGLKAIEDVSVGDRILAYNEETKSPFNASVTQTLHHPSAAQKLHSFYLEDGRHFTSNDVHIIYSVPDAKYVRADELYKRYMRGEDLIFLNEKSKPTRVKYAAVKSGYAKVYNLHVDGISDGGDFRSEGVGHNFFVDGLLVHNMQSVEHK